jgi:HSP20 family protein
MSIIRFDPFADLLTNGRWVPAVDIFENGKQELVLKAELPDMKREDIEVVFENSTLTLKGERKFENVAQENGVKQEQFHRLERAYGAFSRSFSLPSTVDATRIAAEYKHGVLTVTLPFREEAKPRTINVEVAA